MKTGAFTLALAATVLAAQDDFLPNKRDVQTINNVIMDIQGSLTKLDNTVKAFDGKSLGELATDATAVKTSLVSGTQKIMATDPITANDAVSLQGALGPVQTLSTSLIQDLNDKKPAIQQAGLCQIVQQQTGDIGIAANDLIKATVSKVPENLRTVASTITGPFIQQLGDLPLSFNAANCTNGAAGLAKSNSSTTVPGSSSSTSGNKSGASTVAASAFGLILAGAASFMML